MIVAELSYTVGHPLGVAELLGMGKTPTHLVTRSEVLGVSTEKQKSFCFRRW